MSAYYLLTVAAGNLLVVLIADLPILPKTLRFKQVYEFLFFATLIIIFMFVFLILIRNYKYKQVSEEIEKEPSLGENVQELEQMTVEMGTPILSQEIQDIKEDNQKVPIEKFQDVEDENQ